MTTGAERAAMRAEGIRSLTAENKELRQANLDMFRFYNSKPHEVWNVDDGVLLGDFADKGHAHYFRDRMAIAFPSVKYQYRDRSQVVEEIE